MHGETLKNSSLFQSTQQYIKIKQSDILLCWLKPETILLSFRFKDGRNSSASITNACLWHSVCFDGLVLLFEWLDTLSGPGTPHWQGYTITLRHTTLDRTPLD